MGSSGTTIYRPTDLSFCGTETKGLVLPLLAEEFERNDAPALQPIVQSFQRFREKSAVSRK